MNLVHGSLFSGLDAPSVAASWLGWENAFHCEINPFCNVILNYWFPKSEHYEDITKTNFNKWGGENRRPHRWIPLPAIQRGRTAKGSG